MSSKLLRQPSSSVPPSLTRAHPDWRDWAKLDKDMAARIAEHALANDVADYLHFRAVCAPWRLYTKDPKPHCVLDPRYHPRRWILLPEATGVESRRHMVNLSTGNKITVDLPDLLGHVVGAGSGGSPGGVLVLVDERSLIVRLLNPLTGQFIDLASVATVLSRRREGRLDKNFADLCKVTGAGFAGDSMVVLHFGWDNKLVSTKLGDERWEVVGQGALLCSAFPFESKVYFAKKDGLMVVDADATQPRLVLAAEWPSADWTIVHMADNSGKLLVLTNNVHFKPGNDYDVDHKLFQLDADAGQLIRVRDLGERALFVGDFSGALTVSSKDFPTIMPNTIYFQHDRYNKFYVRRISDGGTRLLIEAQKGSFIDHLTSYVSWNGRKKQVPQ